MNKSSSIVIIILSLLILIVTGGIVWQLVSVSDHETAVEPPQERQVEAVTEQKFDETEVLSGVLYVSGKLDEVEDPMSVFEVSVNAGTYTEVPLGEVSQFEYNFDSRNDRFVYIQSNSEAQSPEDEFVIVVSNKNVVSEITLPGLYKRGPRLSSSGDQILVSVSAADFKAGDGLNPEKWEVLLYDIPSEQVISIGRGTMPHWGKDDDYVIYLGLTGVEVFDTQTGITVTGVPLAENSKVNQQMKIGISPNRKTLGWAVPEDRKLYMFDIVSWDPFAGEFENDVELGSDTGFYWPVFSPGSRYIALQSADADPQDDNSFINPRLIVYDRLTKAFTKITNLDEFNFLNFFTDDWR